MFLNFFVYVKMFSFIKEINLIILEYLKYLDMKVSSSNSSSSHYKLYIYLKRIYLELLKIYDDYELDIYLNRFYLELLEIYDEGIIYVIIYSLMKISFEIYVDFVFHLDHYNIFVGFIKKQRQLKFLSKERRFYLGLNKIDLFYRLNRFNYMFIIRKKQFRIKFFPEKKTFRGHLFQHEFPFLLLYKRNPKKKVPLVYCFREQRYMYPPDILTIYQQYIADILLYGFYVGVFDKRNPHFDIFREKNKKIYVLIDYRFTIGITIVLDPRRYLITKIIHQYFFVTSYDNYLSEYYFACSVFNTVKRSIAQEFLLKEFIISFFLFEQIENLFSIFIIRG